MNKSSWQKLSSTYVFESPWYKIRQDEVVRPDGQKGLFNVVERSGPSAFIVPITTDNKIYLIRLFRYTTQHEGWELPAGAAEVGEDLLSAAKRELQEETGLIAKNWSNLGSFESMSSISNSISHVFVARGVRQTNEHMQIEEGITEICAFTLKEVLAMIHAGEISDGLTIAALMKILVDKKLVVDKF